MQLKIGFGTAPQTVDIPDANMLDILRPNDVSAGKTGVEAVEEALRNPIGAPRLREIVKPGEKIVIITSDITRPLPSYKVIPSILDELEAAGARLEDVTVVFALGSHRAQTPNEMNYRIDVCRITKGRHIEIL